MSARDLRTEFELTVAQEWGRFKINALAFVRNNLPDVNGTFGNETSLAGENLYATGELKKSYAILNDSGYAYPGKGSLKYVTVGPTGEPTKYVYYYANGRRNSGTYHGYDFIEQARKDLESVRF